MLKKFGITVLIIIGIIFLFNSLLMPWYVKHTNTTLVPDVIGLNFIEAKQKIEAVGLEVKQGDVKYDESKPIGLVLEQNPPAGQNVKMDRRIYLTVCGGEQLVEVPRLIGRSIRDAKFSLEQRNLQIGDIVKKFSFDIPEDFIVSQVVQPGSKVRKNTKIDLILSNGPELGNLRIPDLIGKKLEEAKKIVTDSKLKIGKINYISSNDVPPGQVLDQYPKKEKSAYENTSVDLFISKKMIKEIPEIEESETGLDEQDKPKENIKEEKQKDENKNTKEPDNNSKSNDKEKKTLPMKREEKNKNENKSEENSGF
ncbi:MAG TPA: PASTA domain-containing protein [Ignavibacteria bacterium]|nr:PASTA domain-containing protein [Ignavibacteria bacterium]